MNRIFLTGNLGKDPETRQVGQTTVCKFTVATDDGYKDKSSGEWVKQINWHNVEVWGWLADKAVNLRKGNKVIVSGCQIYDQWTDDDGNNRTMPKIKAFELELIARLDKQESTSYPEPPPPPNGSDEPTF